MKLHQNKELFQQAVVVTADLKKIKPIYVEKDYWVTLALFTIFNDKIGGDVVFKGGTALVKCFGLIQRFSEDIDLVILKNDADSDNKLKTKLKKITTSVADVLPEIEIEGVTNKLGMIRKTAHSYERLFTGNFGQVRDNIIVEATWLGNFEPYAKGKVSSLIYEMMLNTKQQQLIDEYGMNPFEVQVLNPERTLAEKIMSLVRFSQTQEPITDLSNKIRHTYDLHLILKNKTLHTFFESKDFDKMLLAVASDDVVSFKNNNQWLANHPATALLFSDTAETWNKIKSVYNTSFAELVFGELPNENEILKTLEAVADRLKNVKWKIKL